MNIYNILIKPNLHPKQNQFYIVIIKRKTYQP